MLLTLEKTAGYLLPNQSHLKDIRFTGMDAMLYQDLFELVIDETEDVVYTTNVTMSARDCLNNFRDARLSDCESLSFLELGNSCWAQ
jgi:hypothetical protein